MTTLPSTQAHINDVYEYILGSLQQGKQPGTNKEMSITTGLSPQSLRTAITSLCDTGHLRRWKSRPNDKFSPMHYEIPGHDFPEVPQLDIDPAAEARRKVTEAMVQMRNLHEQGFPIPEIVKLLPDHIDGTGWSESSVYRAIFNQRPNYAHVLKTL